MSETGDGKDDQTGGCLCGSVRFRLLRPTSDVGLCHCGMCRRWSGGPMFALECEDAVAFEGEDRIARYKSSDWAERGFCRRCGSHLFYRLIGGGHYAIPAGALDRQDDLRLTSQIFVDEKPAWYEFANETRRLTGAEAFASFAPPEAKE